MSQRKRTPKALIPPNHKLIKLEQLVLHEYDHGTIRLLHQRLDLATRRMVPDQLFMTIQNENPPWSPPELFFIGAAELVARDTGIEYPLPF